MVATKCIVEFWRNFEFFGVENNLNLQPPQGTLWQINMSRTHLLSPKMFDMDLRLPTRLS